MKRMLVIALWLLSGFCSYGLMLGKSTHEWPDQSTVGFCASYSAVFGPGALLFNLTRYPYHWRVVPLTTEQQWEAFHSEYPDSSREYFNRSH